MHGDIGWVWWLVYGFWLLVALGAVGLIALVCWIRWRP